jgi:hypothetical protein
MHQQVAMMLHRLALPLLHRGILLQRFNQSLELIAVGELGVALENLCDNLFEFNVHLDRGTCDELTRLGKIAGVSDQRLDLLAKLVVVNPDASSQVTIRNDTESPIQLIFEPWAAEYEIQPNSSRDLVATSPRPGHLDVVVTQHGIQVYAWCGSIAAVYDATGTLVDCLDVRVPDYDALPRSSASR